MMYDCLDIKVILNVDCSATDDDNSKPSTGFNDYIIINSKTAVTNLPECRYVKRIPLHISSQQQYCRTIRIKHKTDITWAWTLKYHKKNSSQITGQAQF